ncbi:MAG: alpha/beta hydrolase [Deltaproteobacteria bacterium]|nr:alpha/beta hydrolase [Deltaproteobacteria bacterium]
MPYVLANGIKQHYQMLGEGPRVVMIHGLLLDNLSLWYFTAGQVIKRHRQALMYDLRCHGNSDKAHSGFDLETLSRDLEGLLEALAPGEQVDLCGFSYGCLIALHYAMKHPDRVLRLVLIDAPLPPIHVDADRLRQADRETLVAALPEHFKEIVFKAPGRIMKLAQRLRFMAYKTSLLDDVQREAPISADGLSALALPVMCIYGNRSEYRQDGERLVSALPQAEMRIVDGTHRLLNENAAEVMGIVEEFLNE